MNPTSVREKSHPPGDAPTPAWHERTRRMTQYARIVKQNRTISAQTTQKQSSYRPRKTYYKIDAA